MTPLYTAEAIVYGTGREGGWGRTSDNQLKLEFSMPKELGGRAEEGATNPEQLVAMGYAACFGSALQFVAKQRQITLTDPEVTARVRMGRNTEGGFAFEFEIEARLPGLEPQAADDLVAAAHQVCPYSNAFKNGAPTSARAVAVESADLA